jgi:FMN reductase
MIVILSSSLNTESNSRILARAAHQLLRAAGVEAEWLDLRDHPLPLCDGGAAYQAPAVAQITARLRSADAVLIATPIYNYDATAALKNLIELSGGAWENKVGGFLCAAGGLSSYMSIMALANSLMLDFRSVIVPRFVYATGDAFANGAILDPQVTRRVEELVTLTAKLSTALQAA